MYGSSLLVLLLAGFTLSAAAERLEIVDLPMGFFPEGITIGRDWNAYVGSLAGEFI